MATRPIQTTTKTLTARRKLPALVLAGALALSLLSSAAPTFAEEIPQASDAAGCQAFGQGIATGAELFHPLGQTLVREQAPANDNVERTKALLCPAP